MSIAEYWPPQPGPNQTNTGWKQCQTQLQGGDSWFESLTGLHVRNWWSGVRVGVAEGDGAGGPTPTFRCRIMAGPIVVAEWTQEANTWTPFPALISGRMAVIEDLCLKITLMTQERESIHANILICFHELD
jgi:hypothetical protein